MTRLATGGVGVARLGAALLALALGVGAIWATASAQQFDESNGGSLSWAGPPHITSIVVTQEGFQINWQQPEVSGLLKGYSIQRANPTGEFREIVFDAGTSQPYFLDTLEVVDPQYLESGKIWMYQVRAIIWQNGQGTLTPWSSVELVTVPELSRPAITGVQKNQPWGVAFTVMWQSPWLSWSTHALPLTGYIVWQSQEGSVFEIDRLGADQTSYALNKPLGDVTYAFQAIYGPFLSPLTHWLNLN